MSDDESRERLIVRGEQMNARLASGSFRGANVLLSRDQWLASCETTTEFYVEFYDQVERSLSFMVEHGSQVRPEILTVLSVSNLEEDFAPIDRESAVYGAITAEIKYLLARALVSILDGQEVGKELVPRAEAALAALWSLPGASRIGPMERWRAYGALLYLAGGEYQECIDLYESDCGFDLARQENAARTLAKACYVLAKIADGDVDADTRFGASTFVAVLQLFYYLWLVNEDPCAEIELPVLALVFHLEGEITGRHEDFFYSMTPRNVLRELDLLRS